MSADDFLRVPRAHGAAVGSARVRVVPEDFLVREWLGFEADGEGDHLLLRVRKRGANTAWVAKELARLGRIPVRDVGYAGLKDREAVAEQAFTVPARSALGEQWVGIRGEGFEVLDAKRHRRKLKRGALRGNEFTIVLRDFQGERSRLEQRLAMIAARGVPNYFGPQRFGRAGRNIATALQWFEQGIEPQDRAQRGFAISAARSALFNAVLAERVQQGSWDRLLPGDLANLDGSGSIFEVTEVDAQLGARCEALDIHPSGPLWHGVSTAGGSVRELEEGVAERFAALADGLQRIAPEPQRRALRARVAELRWSIEDDTNVRLSFRLAKGSFATAVLHELIEGAFATEVPEAD